MKENMIQTFTNSEFGELDVLQDGEKFFFPAVECATILGYTKPHNAVLVSAEETAYTFICAGHKRADFFCITF